MIVSHDGQERLTVLVSSLAIEYSGSWRVTWSCVPKKPHSHHPAPRLHGVSPQAWGNDRKASLGRCVVLFCEQAVELMTATLSCTLWRYLTTLNYC